MSPLLRPPWHQPLWSPVWTRKTKDLMRPTESHSRSYAAKHCQTMFVWLHSEYLALVQARSCLNTTAPQAALRNAVRVVRQTLSRRCGLTTLLQELDTQIRLLNQCILRGRRTQFQRSVTKSLAKALESGGFASDAQLLLHNAPPTGQLPSQRILKLCAKNQYAMVAWSFTYNSTLKTRMFPHSTQPSE